MSHDAVALLAGTLARSTVVLGAALLLVAAVRRLSAEERHLILAAGLSGLLVLPAAALLPKTPLPLEPIRVQFQEWAAAGVGVVEEAGPDVGAAGEASAPGDGTVEDGAAEAGEPRSRAGDRSAARSGTAGDSPGAARGRASTEWDGPAARLYAAVAILLLAYVVLVELRIARRVRALKPLTDSAAARLAAVLANDLRLRRGPRLLVSETDATPWAWGFMRPIIVLPDSFRAWSAKDQRNALVHELSHIRRHDALSVLLGRICCALFWFQPLVWIAVRRMKREAEHACDDRVLLRGADEPAYAGQLLDIANAIYRERRYSGVTAMAATSFVTDRIQSILDPRKRRSVVSRSKTAWALLATLLFVVPLATVTSQDNVPADAVNDAELAVLLRDGPSDEQQLERVVRSLLADDRVSDAERVLVRAITAGAACRVCVRGLIEESAHFAPESSSGLGRSVWNAFDAVERDAERDANGALLMRLATMALRSREKSAISRGIHYLLQANRLGAADELDEQGALVAVEYLLALGQHDAAEAMARKIHDDPSSTLYQTETMAQWLEYIEQDRSRADAISKQLAGASDTAAAVSEYLPLHKAAPEYPEEAARRGTEGYVVVEYTVTSSGRTAEARVVESTDPVFDEAAVASVAEYRYLPRVDGGVPVPVQGVKTKILFASQH